MAKEIKVGIIPWLLILVVAILGFAGWAMNIMTIAGSSFNDLTGLLILRVVGIFIAPMGAVLGWI
jgi:hypothetical protein